MFSDPAWLSSGRPIVVDGNHSTSLILPPLLDMKPILLCRIATVAYLLVQIHPARTAVLFEDKTRYLSNFCPTKFGIFLFSLRNEPFKVATLA